MVDSSWPPPPKENPSNKCPKNAGQISLLDSGILSTAQQDELAAIYRSINPAQLTRQILTYQDRLISLAKEKTLTIAAGLEDKQQARQKRRTTGIRTKAS